MELDKPYVECLAELGGVPVKYKFRRGHQDRQHLLVVFSSNPDAYDFDGQSLSGCHSNILWVKDDFGDQSGDYPLGFKSERTIVALIDAVLSQLKLSHTQCTLYGASTGGCAAIYYGVKYNYTNIITSCPQIKIGSCYSGKKQSDTEFLDRLIPDLLANDIHRSSNIYLIHSPHDKQYKEEIEPYLALFEKYDNFNIVFTHSALVWQHNTIERYNVPLLLSIIDAHYDGVTPRFAKTYDEVPFKAWESNAKLTEQRERKQPVAVLHGVQFNGGVLFPKGVALIRGYPCPDYGYISRKLILRSDKQDYSFALGSIKDNMISYTFYKEAYCDYQTAAFASMGNKGIDLTSLPCDSYSLQVDLHVNTEQCRTNLTVDDMDIKSIDGPYEYRVFSGETGAVLVKRDMRELSQQGIFRLKNSWQKNEFLHYEGVFIVPGIELKEWGEAKYYLLLRCGQHTFSFSLGMCHRPELNKELGGQGIYQKAYFSTIGGKGVNISGLQIGTYDAYIVMSYQSSLFAHKIEQPVYRQLEQVEKYKNIEKIQYINNIQNEIYHWNFNSVIKLYIDAAHSRVDLLLADCYRLMAEMGKIDEIIYSIEHIGLSLLESKVSNLNQDLSLSLGFFIGFYKNKYLPATENDKNGINGESIDLLSLIVKNNIKGCSDLISNHEALYINDKITKFDGMILIYAINKLALHRELRVETAIQIANTLLENKNIDETSKKYIIKTLIDHCHDNNLHDFFKLRTSYYNHIQKISHVLARHINEPGAIRLYKNFNKLLKTYNNTNLIKKPRIAVCISGMIRGNAHSLDTIHKHIVEPLDADVFIHTWDVYHSWSGLCGGPKTLWSSRLFGKQVSNVIPDQILDFNNFKSKFPKSADIIEKPVKLALDYSTLNDFIHYTSAVIESEDRFLSSLGKYQEKFKSRGNFNQAKMFYGIHAAAKQVITHEDANNIKYDYILRLRADCTILSPLTINDICNTNENEIAIGMSSAVGPNDGFFICKRDTYLTVSSLWEASFSAKSLSPFEEYPLYDAHALFYLWMIYHNISPVKSPARDDYHQATTTAPCPIQLGSTIIEEFNSQDDIKKDVNYQVFIKTLLDVIENEKNSNRP